jgi:glutamyl-tRNA synthetase
MVTPFLAANGIARPDDAKLLLAIPTVRERARTLREAADAMDYFFRAPVFDEKAKKKFLTPDNAAKLADLKSILLPLGSWDESAIESAMTAWLTAQNIAIKDIAQPARVALTGRTISPGLYEVLAVLGKEESLARLDRGIELCSA